MDLQTSLGIKIFIRISVFIHFLYNSFIVDTLGVPIKTVTV